MLSTANVVQNPETPKKNQEKHPLHNQASVLALSGGQSRLFLLFGLVVWAGIEANTRLIEIYAPMRPTTANVAIIVLALARSLFSRGLFHR